MTPVRTMFAAACCVLLLATSTATWAQATSTYTITDLGALGDFETFANDINDAGEVTGTSHVSAAPNPGYVRHAFLWRDGQMTDLGVLIAGGYARGTEINDVGEVVGLAEVAGNANTWALHTGNGYMDLMPPGDSATGRGLNNRGQVVGFISFNNVSSPYVWDIVNGFVALPPLGASNPLAGGFAETANDHGDIVGWSHPALPNCGGVFLGPRPTLWSDNGSGYQPTDLGTINGGCSGHVWDLNEFGLAVGYSGFISTVPIQWRRQTNGNWVPSGLGSLGPIGGGAYGVNNEEQIVGESDNRAFLWECGVMKDLNTMIPAGTGWHLERATAINDAGEIVGWGRLNGSPWKGFLLRPTSKDCTCKGGGGIDIDIDVPKQ